VVGLVSEARNIHENNRRNEGSLSNTAGCFGLGLSDGAAVRNVPWSSAWVIIVGGVRRLLGGDAENPE